MINERDLAFLKVHSFNYLSIDNIPDNKRWMTVYLAKKEIKILAFYSLFRPFIHETNYRAILRNFWINFTGLRAYPFYFYKTIDKFEYLDMMMVEANKTLDIEKIASLHSGKCPVFYEPKILNSFTRIDFKNVVEKYPLAFNKIQDRLRVSRSIFKNDDMATFRWFILQRNNFSELVCKKGTKFTYSEAI